MVFFFKLTFCQFCYYYSMLVETPAQDVLYPVQLGEDDRPMPIP